MASWQEQLTSSQAKLAHIFSSGDMSDVTFVVGDPPEQKQFKLHKLILSMSSDVFFTMFYGSLPEMGEVKVPDIHPDIFEITMKYVYEESFSVKTMEQAMYAYFASEKYNISHLRDLCAAYITDNLSPENLPILYKMPVLLETLQVKSKCKIMLSGYTSDILTSENFAKAPFDMVKDIVQLECLNVSSEENLFDLVLKWAKSICLKLDPTYTMKELRAVMDPFLPHIRFLGMSANSFLLGPVRSGILTDSEISSISENLVAPGCRDLPIWCNKGLSRNTTYRFPLTDSHTCSLTARTLRSIECFIFMRSGNILFKGVSVYVPSFSDFPKKSFEINIVESTKRSYNTETTTRCSYDTKTSLLKCMLLEPFPLSFGKKYNISLIANSSIFIADSYIFTECDFARSEKSVRRNQDFEMDYTLIRETDYPSGYNLGRRLSQSNFVEYQSSIHFGCARFYEILYSKF